MKEMDLRRWHRRLGIALALFVLFQAGSGLLLTLGEVSIPHSQAHLDSGSEATHSEGAESAFAGALAWLHHGGGPVGLVYRLSLGVGIIGLAVTGSAIYLKMRSRLRKKRVA